MHPKKSPNPDQGSRIKRERAFFEADVWDSRMQFVRLRYALGGNSV